MPDNTAQRATENVRENWMIYDTVMITAERDESVAGWFNNWAAAGAANSWSFFNVRNRNVGIPYNNQDVRDQMPFAMRIHSIGVSFWAASMTTFQVWNAGYDDFAYDDVVNHIFANDIPRHCGFTLKIQQDERLKITVPMVPAGYGPHGDGWGRGSVAYNGAPGVAPISVLPDVALNVQSSSSPHMAHRWAFPNPLEVPRRASLSVDIQATEYAKQLLQAMPPSTFMVAGAEDETTGTMIHDLAGIQVSIMGDRLVQQRGQYHV